MDTRSRTAGAARKGERIITKVDLHEVGPCLVGANEEAQLVGVKSIDEPETESPDFEGMSTEEFNAYSLAMISNVDRKSRITIHSIPC